MDNAHGRTVSDILKAIHGSEDREATLAKAEAVIDGEVRSDLRQMIRLIEEETTAGLMPPGAAGRGGRDGGRSR